MADWLLVSGQGLAFIPALYQKRQRSRFKGTGYVNFRDLVQGGSREGLLGD